MFLHKTAAAGAWQKLSLAEQLGNIGSEISRTLNWQGKNDKLFLNAARRALELFDLTLDDARWNGRHGEIARAREVFCDATWNGGKEYKSDLRDLNKYFYHFAYAARNGI